MPVECVNRRCDFWEENKETHCSSNAIYSEKCTIALIRERKSEYPVPYYIFILKSSVCTCGRNKLEGKPFCFICQFKIPRKISANLGCRIGDGKEEAIDQAVKYLAGWG